MQIYHYTHQPFRADIEESGFIGLEGCRVEHVVNAGHHLDHPEGQHWSQHWRELKKALKVRGRFVWFTEQPFCHSIGQPEVPKVRFSFDSEAIRAFAWPAIMEMRQADKKRFRAMRAFSEAAISRGDDPLAWWVCFEPVSLDLVLDTETIGVF